MAITVSKVPAQWNPETPIGAGEIEEWLIAQGVTGILGTSVSSTGQVSIGIQDPTQAAAVVAALDLLDPASEAAVPLNLREARQLVTDVRQVIASIEAIPPGSRSQEQTALLREGRLLLAVVRHLWRTADGG